MTMRTSQNGFALVKAFESCMAAVRTRPGFFKPYKDAVGVLTIGWGHTNHHLPRFEPPAPVEMRAPGNTRHGPCGSEGRTVGFARVPAHSRRDAVAVSCFPQHFSAT